MKNFAANDAAAEKGLGGVAPEPQPGPAPESKPSCADSSPASTERHHEGRDGVDYNKFLQEECMGYEDYLELPPGWPRLAAMPTYFNNTDVLRNFNAVGMRLVQYRGARLAFLTRELGRFDKELNTHLTTLTEYQTRLPGQSKAKGKLDTLQAELEKEFLAYANLVLHYKGLIQLHPVPRAHFRDMLSFILKVNGPMLEGDSLLWVNSPDEAVCVSKPLPDFMVWLVHTSPVKRLVRKLVGAGGGSQTRFIPRAHLVLFHKTLITLGALAVLVPIGIIFLCDLTKGQSFGVVLSFSVIFSLSITLTQEADSHKAWLVVCAFSAVLVTVMVQLATVAPQK